jgi:hypothetical protein
MDYMDYFILKKANSHLYALRQLKKAGLHNGIFLKYIALWLGLVLNMHHLCGRT